MVYDRNTYNRREYGVKRWLVFFCCWMLLACASGAKADSDLSARCRELGWSDAQIAAISRQAERVAAFDEGDELILMRVREGLAKSVPPDVIVAAVEKRVNLYILADQLTRATGCPNNELTRTVGRALESGLSEESLTRILQAGNGYRPGQVRAVIETGEILYLNGLPEDVTEGVMSDFLERNLRRSEMQRAARIIENGWNRGASLEDVRSGLWQNSGKQPQHAGGRGAYSGRHHDGGGDRSGFGRGKSR
jgi:hypothetical protein